MNILNLEQEQNYLLNWRTVKSNGQIHNMITLKGEFIKYFNNSYYEQFINYKMNNEDSQELIGTILTKRKKNIVYPFDDPLYPYSRMFTSTFSNGCNLGLFKILSIENSVFRGIERPFRNNNPYNFVSLSCGTLINTPLIEYNETLMWVDLNLVTLESLPSDVTNYIKSAL